MWYHRNHLSHKIGGVSSLPCFTVESCSSSYIVGYIRDVHPNFHVTLIQHLLDWPSSLAITLRGGNGYLAVLNWVEDCFWKCLQICLRDSRVALVKVKVKIIQPTEKAIEM